MVCPIGGGSPTPAPASECVFPLDPKRGGEVVGVPNTATGSLALCILCAFSSSSLKVCLFSDINGNAFCVCLELGAHCSLQYCGLTPPPPSCNIV